MSYPLSDLEQRLANLLRVGTVEAVDHDAKRARVRIGGNLTAPLPWLAMRAGGDRTWWPVEVGEQVLVLSPSGDMTQGVILPALYSSAAPAPSSTPGVDRAEYADGAVIEYNRNTHTLTATIPGDVTVTASGSITASAGLVVQASAGEKILLAAPLIQIAGPVTFVGLNGEPHGATIAGDITHVDGDYTNPEGDVVASGKSLVTHTHLENGPGSQTDPPT